MRYQKKVYSENEGEVFLGRSVTNQKNVSEATMQMVDLEIRKIIDQQYKIARNLIEENEDLAEIEKKIVKILDQKIRPAVAKDGGDIKFKEYSNGIVKVQLQGSCSGCPSSTLTLKQGVQNLLCHYIPEVKEVISI